jgi:hypothetical protein
MKISFYSGQVGYPEDVDVLFTPYTIQAVCKQDKVIFNTKKPG